MIKYRSKLKRFINSKTGRFVSLTSVQKSSKARKKYAKIIKHLKKPIKSRKKESSLRVYLRNHIPGWNKIDQTKQVSKGGPTLAARIEKDERIYKTIGARKFVRDKAFRTGRRVSRYEVVFSVHDTEGYYGIKSFRFRAETNPQKIKDPEEYFGEPIKRNILPWLNATQDEQNLYGQLLYWRVYEYEAQKISHTTVSKARNKTVKKG